MPARHSASLRRPATGALAVGARVPVAEPAGAARVADADGSRERAVAEMQRSRLLAAAVRALEEQGYEHASVAHITRRARVSRRTFYELFTNREQCIAAVLQDAAGCVRQELGEAGLEGLSWRERMRGGLWTILCFLQREPALARVLVVHSQRGSGAVLAAREQIVAQLVAAVDAGRAEAAREAGCSALTAEGVVGATLAIVQRRLSRRDQPRLGALLGELTATIVLPYLGAAAARREQASPAPAAPHTPRGARGREQADRDDPLAGLQMRLTYRTVRALEGVGRQPGASNRRVGEYAGIGDQGQISKLLGRLERLGLIVNEGSGRGMGEPNRWMLTARGRSMARSIAPHLEGADGRRAA